jgi:glycerophosphoryl diester phosphodiesterase
MSRRRLLPVVGAMLLACAATAAAQSLSERLARGPVVIAHRARLTPALPENSLRQAATTTAAGLGIEVDLARSADGDLYLLHDATLERTSDGHGALRDQHAAALQRLRLRDGAGQRVDEPLARFDALLDWAARTPQALLMLDLKGTPAAQVVPQLAAQGVAARSILLTFDRAATAEALAQPGPALVSALLTRGEDIAGYQALAGTRRLAFYVPANADPALFAAAHASGALVISDSLDGTAGDRLDGRDGCRAYRDWVQARHVDILVSNQPQCAAQALQSMPAGG